MLIAQRFDQAELALERGQERIEHRGGRERAAEHGVERLSGAFGWSAERDDVWDRVFYLYQCAQLALVIAAYSLLLRLARVYGLTAPWVPALVAGLLVFDDAVFRTLRHGQVNFFVLDLSLAALLSTLSLLLFAKRIRLLVA